MSLIALAASLSLLTASSCNFCCNKKTEATEVVEEAKEAMPEANEAAAEAVAEEADTLASATSTNQVVVNVNADGTSSVSTI